MRKLFVAATATALLISASIANAKEDTIGEIRAKCVEFLKGLESDRVLNFNPFEAGVCLGLVQGYSNGHVAGLLIAGGAEVATLKKPYPGNWCEPEGVNNGQRIKVFQNWADRNPASWHEVWFLGFARAFKEAWPCKK